MHGVWYWYDLVRKEYEIENQCACGANDFIVILPVFGVPRYVNMMQSLERFIIIHLDERSNRRLIKKIVVVVDAVVVVIIIIKNNQNNK